MSSYTKDLNLNLVNDSFFMLVVHKQHYFSPGHRSNSSHPKLFNLFSIGHRAFLLSSKSATSRDLSLLFDKLLLRFWIINLPRVKFSCASIIISYSTSQVTKFNQNLYVMSMTCDGHF